MAHVELDNDGKVAALFAIAQEYTTEIADDDQRLAEFIAESERRRNQPSN